MIVSSSRTVVVVDPYSSGNLLAPAFAAAGYRVVAVTSTAVPPQIYRSSYQPDDFDLVVPFTEDHSALVEALRQEKPLALVPGAETGVELCDRLAAELTPEWANAPELISARRHKAHMAAAVAAKGLATIRTLCTADEDEVERWLADEGLNERDIVLKPPKCGGTDGVTLVPAGRDWRKPFRDLLRNRNSYGVHNDEVVVQEYVTGTEYVVDTVSFRGRHTVTDIARYGKVRIGDRMAVYESMEFLPYDGDGHAELVAYVENVLDALGVRHGAAHTEIMLTERGPVLVETGARLAGGGLPWTCAVATGESPVDRMVRVISGDTGIRRDFTLLNHVTIVFFLARSSGRIRKTAALQRIRSLASVRYLKIGIADGDVVTTSSDLPSSLTFGYAILAHPDEEQVRADHAEVRAIEAELVIEPLVDLPAPDTAGTPT